VVDLFGDGRVAGVQTGGQVGDATHDGSVAGSDDDAGGGAFRGNILVGHRECFF